MKKSYTGINIQFPISELIISGKKIIETRTYPCPKHLLNEEILFVETPGKKGTFKARILAVVKITDCFLYKNKSSFYADAKKHLVTPDSPWAWKDKPKWGWKLELVKILEKPQEVTGKKGIIYTKNLKLKD